MNTNIILAFLFSNLTAIFASFFTQLLVQKYNVHQIIFINALVFLLFSISYQIIKNKKAIFDKKEIKSNIIIGILFFISLSFWYYGLKYTSLVETTTLKFLTPIFIMLFSFILLKKKIEYKNWLIAIFGLTGAGAIAYFNSSKIGVYCVLLSVIFSTLFHLYSRKFPTENILNRSIMIRFVSFIFSMIVCVFNYKNITLINGNYLIILALMIITSSIYFLISNKLNTYKNIIFLQPLNLIRILFAIIIEYSFMQTTSNIYTLFGILLIIFTIIMISVFKEYENELLKKNKELEVLNAERNNTFIQIVHDLKIPISIIKQSNNILVNKIKKNNSFDEETEKFFNFIKNNSLKLENNVNNILKLKHLEEIKNMQNTYTKINIQELLEESIDGIILLAKEKNIKINLTNNSTEIFFIIDEIKLKIIINNMLSNAIKFAKNFININFKITNNLLELSFSNDGNLISDEAKNKINNHEEFKNILSENSTGFGFQIISKMVNLLDGKMEINNKDENEFIFKFKKIND